MPTIDLHDVTICAADSAYVNLTVRALNRSIAECRFGDAILFSDQPADGPFRWVQIPRLTSIADYSRFCLYGLVNFIRTPFVLIVQWDGYVINPLAWANAFRKYDYIGAAWHGRFPAGTRLVGNGGFSLRSRNLLNAVKRLPPVGDYWEDRVICHVFGTQLEREDGIRFAPVKVADRFAYESKVPEQMPFGFHGVQHMWRHAEDEEFARAVEDLDLSKAERNGTLGLIRSCADNGLINSATVLYDKFRRLYTPVATEHVLAQYLGPEEAARTVALLEALVSPRQPTALS